MVSTETTSVLPASPRRRETGRALLFLALSLILFGCARSPGAEGLPAYEPGVTTTYPDRRTINDPRTAAAFVTQAGDVRWFDDIGRLLSHAAGGGEAPATMWVHDYEKEVWLRADAARYVASPTLVTPRGSGIIAVGSDEAAGRLALATSGRVLTFEELPGYLAAAAALDLLPPAGGGLELGGVLEADEGH